MPIIWFIRHAESETNVGLPTISPLTSRLTPAGREQAQSIARYFTTPPELIITSSYMRTKQTAEPTQQHFPDAHVEEWPVHEFTYLSESLGSGPTTINQRRPLVDAYWERLDSLYTDGEGAESFMLFMQRVQGILEQLRNANEGTIAVFSHGQFILGVLSQLMGLIIDNMEQFKHFRQAHEIPNGAIMIADLRPDGEVWFSPFLTSHLPPRP